LTQLGDAGLSVDGPDDEISESQKMQLLHHLRSSHGHAEGIQAPKSSTSQVTLKRRSTSQLRQGATSGRAPRGATSRPSGAAKSVSVEVRRKRTITKPGAKTEAPVGDNSDAVEAARLAREDQQKAQEQLASETQARRDLAEKKRGDEEERQQAVADAKVKADADLKSKEDEKARHEAKAAREAANKPTDVPPSKADTRTDRDRNKKTRYGREELHVAAGKGRRKKKKGRRAPVVAAGDGKHAFEMPTEFVAREIKIPETISVADLAQAMSVKGVEVVKTMMGMGSMVTINQVIDQETAAIVVEEMGHQGVMITDEDLEADLGLGDVEEGESLTRPPVVTIMGHVDHGKTSLLDYIRKAKVAAGESGGITQHIGAYHVETGRGMITFIDTPGHAAFTAMRARGAKITDIVILVVAADDGVMPQTIEAIQHCKAGGVPMIVAVNKIDRVEAEPDRVRQELSQHEVMSEEWGGDTQFVHVSAMDGTGIDALLDAILLQAEILELGAIQDCPASGVVIESSLDRGRGPVATILIRQGTMNIGDIIISGNESGRVRAMFDEAGNSVEKALPSFPVVALGLSGVPGAGEEVYVVEDERKAREITTRRHDKQRDLRLASQKATKLEDMFSQMQEGEISTLNLLIKADVQGSVEALKDSLLKLASEDIKINVVAAGVGGISESDANLAAASEAVIIGFNVRADAAARGIIDEMGLDLHYHSVIYNVIDSVKKSIGGLLGPVIKEVIVGVAEVRDVFTSPRFGLIAGCMVSEGTVKRNNPIRVLRDNVVIYEGELESLRRFKDDVSDVKSGTECGIGVKNYTDVHAGDQIEVFERIEVERVIE
jgi:translation initiation factor IF-2